MPRHALEKVNMMSKKNGPKFHIDDDQESGIKTIDRQKVKRPPRFKVLMHNDDYTTMEFVIYILEKIFKKNKIEAEAIMLKIHHDGVGLCGVFTYEIAETKMAQVHKLAKENGHPLKCSLEPES